MNYTSSTSSLTSKLDLRLHAQHHAFCFELGRVVSGVELHQLLNGTKACRQGHYSVSELTFRCAHTGCQASVTPQDYGPYYRDSEACFRKVVGGIAHNDDCPMALRHKKPTGSDSFHKDQTPCVPKHLKLAHDAAHRSHQGQTTSHPTVEGQERATFNRAQLSYSASISNHLIKPRITTSRSTDDKGQVQQLCTMGADSRFNSHSCINDHQPSPTLVR